MSVVSKIVDTIVPWSAPGEASLPSPANDRAWLISHLERAPDPLSVADDFGLQQNPCSPERFIGTIKIEPNGPQPNAREFLLIEAGRQMGLAIARMFYRAPPAHEFGVTQLTVEFWRDANLDAPLTAETTVGRQSFSKGRFARMAVDTIIHQHGRNIARVAGTVVVVEGGVSHAGR